MSRQFSQVSFPSNREMSMGFFPKLIAMNSFVDFSSVNGEPSGGCNSQPDLIAPNVGNHQS
jgi:hypothetical protein